MVSYHPRVGLRFCFPCLKGNAVSDSPTVGKAVGLRYCVLHRKAFAGSELVGTENDRQRFLIRGRSLTEIRTRIECTVGAGVWDELDESCFVITDL
jgi:hypothetical protein